MHFFVAHLVPSLLTSATERRGKLATYYRQLAAVIASDIPELTDVHFRSLREARRQLTPAQQRWQRDMDTLSPAMSRE